MTKPLVERGANPENPVVQRNARMSATRRARRPVPATREEAEELFRPRSGGNERAVVTGPRLCRLAAVGLLELRSTPGPRVTNLEAHEALLDFYWPLEHASPPDA